MERQMWNDLMKLRLAARKVRAAAELESKALDEYDRAPGPDTSAVLHQAHHDELGAVQQMVACLDLLERRNPEILVAPAAVPGRERTAKR